MLHKYSGIFWVSRRGFVRVMTVLTTANWCARSVWDQFFIQYNHHLYEELILTSTLNSGHPSTYGRTQYLGYSHSADVNNKWATLTVTGRTWKRYTAKSKRIKIETAINMDLAMTHYETRMQKVALIKWIRWVRRCKRRRAGRWRLKSVNYQDYFPRVLFKMLKS